MGHVRFPPSGGRRLPTRSGHNLRRFPTRGGLEWGPLWLTHGDPVALLAIFLAKRSNETDCQMTKARFAQPPPSMDQVIKIRLDNRPLNEGLARPLWLSLDDGQQLDKLGHIAPKWDALCSLALSEANLRPQQVS